MATKQEKQEKQAEKGYAKFLKSRAKAEKQPAKRAKKQTNKERNRTQGFIKARKAASNLQGLPPILWPLVAMVTYIWARNAWEKERQERDVREARRFLQELRTFKK